MRTQNLRQIEAALLKIWSETLVRPIAELDPSANFFSAGGDSMLMLQVMDRVNRTLLGDVPEGLPIADFFTYGTLRELARRVAECGDGKDPHAPDSAAPGAIAIIGMEGRFPGIRNVREFWTALCEGRETLTFFSEEQLVEAGVSAADLDDSRYVRCAGLLSDVQSFDAEEFGITATEAAQMSPEQRLLLECAQETLEAAGYAARWKDEGVGAFVGCGISSYLLDHFEVRSPRLESSAGMRALVANTSAATRLAFLLNLRGPCLTVDTACSSSLVAVHLACRALLNGECEMALAGGATVRRFGARGYRAEEGGILSPDGHCRPFDSHAQGTIASSGAGLVLLKPLEAARADRDTVYAVIRGSAISNDGSGKVGYTAPSAAGQAAALHAAYRAAGVDPSTVGYVETHGTATALGDAIEIAALAEVFRGNAGCRLGTLKANMGHLEAAAGVASLMKAALALKHEELPPNIHFKTPNPQLGLERTPFSLNAALECWPTTAPARRAGVSSFGIGGTNAHAVLEAAPRVLPTQSHRPCQLLTLSARTPHKLRARSRELADHLASTSDQSLADVAFSLEIGRAEHPYRAVCVSESATEAILLLQSEAQQQERESLPAGQAPPVVFMFPGQGSQHLRMTAGLYWSEPAFREPLDRCAQSLLSLIELDIRSFLDPGRAERDEAWLEHALMQTQWAQPALFAVEYALARLWQSWGVQPDFVIGHSLGEYVAACISGVLALEDALTLVCHRARLMQAAPHGSMLAVQLGREALEGLLPADCCLAAANSDSRCVISGPRPAIARLQLSLENRGVSCTPAPVAHAFHSSLMDEASTALQEITERVEHKEVGVPYVSTLDGKLFAQGARLPSDYWKRQLRHTVEFASGVRTLLQGAQKIFLEVGPGTVLSSCVRNIAGSQSHIVAASCRHPRHEGSDSRWLMHAVGRLWKAGTRLDWAAFNAFNLCGRVPLPTTPFERRRHWLEPPALDENRHSESSSAGADDSRAYLYAPTWRQTLAADPAPGVEGRACLLLDRGGEATERLARDLEAVGWRVTHVRIGAGYAWDANVCTIEPTEPMHYDRLLEDVEARTPGIALIVHAWRAQTAGTEPDSLKECVDHGFFGLIHLCQAMGRRNERLDAALFAMTVGAHSVFGEAIVYPADAMLPAVLRVIAREFAFLCCRAVDVSAQDSSAAQSEALLREIRSQAAEPVVALRGSARFTPSFERLVASAASRPASLLRPGGAYLITGGLGGLGRTFAAFLARSVGARLALVSRTPLPDRSTWEQRLAASADDEIALRIRAVLEMESLGSQVLLLTADVCELQELRSAVQAACQAFGTIHGVIHTAGVAGGGVVALKDRASAATVFAPKIEGTGNVLRALESITPDFVVSCSSLASILAPAGQCDYVAANAFQDALAHACDRPGSTRHISIDWDVWKELGMAVRNLGAIDFGLSCEEGCRALDEVLRHPRPQWIVSSRELGSTLAQSAVPESSRSARRRSATEIAPTGSNARTLAERTIGQIWSELLGIAAPDVDVDFFDSGGDSLLAVQLGAQLESHFARPFTLRQILEAPTIASLARQLEARS
jgi:phthiocerol/phenolphthiocerol synthesis type-I polyketide synthase E